LLPLKTLPLPRLPLHPEATAFHPNRHADPVMEEKTPPWPSVNHDFEIASSLVPRSPRQTSRRTALGLAGVAAATALPAHALFESPEQLALISLATAKPKLSSLVKEVDEVARKRAKMALDPDDDAYVFRFARAILDPAVKEMAIAAPKIKQARAQELPGLFQASLTDLDDACRATSAGDELQALRAAESALGEFLELANKERFDVMPRDDINAFQGGKNILYNKFLFRAG